MRTDVPERRFAVGNVLLHRPSRRPDADGAAARPHSGRLLVTFDEVATARRRRGAAGHPAVIDVDQAGPSATMPDDATDAWWDSDSIGLIGAHRRRRRARPGHRRAAQPGRRAAVDRPRGRTRAAGAVRPRHRARRWTRPPASWSSIRRPACWSSEAACGWTSSRSSRTTSRRSTSRCSGKARERGDLEVGVHDLRAWTDDVHRTVDDSPYGGGPGMIMRPEPWGRALQRPHRRDVRRRSHGAFAGPRRHPHARRPPVRPGVRRRAGRQRRG